MFQRYLSTSVVVLLGTIVSHVSAADGPSRFTLSVGTAGYGSLSISDAGKVRGMMRLGGKPVSFSATIEGGHFAVRAKAAKGAIFDADFTVVGDEIAGAGTVGGQSVGIAVMPSSAGAFCFCGAGATPVTVNIRKASVRTFLTGSLASNGRFTASDRFNSPLSLKLNKKAGLATGKLGGSPFIGIISADIVSAICDDGSRITIRSFAPPVALGAASQTLDMSSLQNPRTPAAPQRLTGSLTQNLAGSTLTATPNNSVVSQIAGGTLQLQHQQLSPQTVVSSTAVQGGLRIPDAAEIPVATQLFELPDRSPQISNTLPFRPQPPIAELSQSVPASLGAVLGAVSLVKSGTGVLTIGEAPIFGGSTSVSGGTLVLNGSLSGSSVSLGSAGSILSVSGGTISPGAHAGVLNLAGASALNVSPGTQVTVSSGASPQSVENILRSAFVTRPVDTSLLGDPANGTIAIEDALAAWQTRNPQFVFSVTPEVLRAAFYTATFNQPVPAL